jgi:alpha-mannosidase
LLPHAHGWEAAQTPRRAAELNQAPVALLCTFHDGKLAASQSYISVAAPNVIVSVVKQAEDNDDLIIRAYETDKCTTSTTIHLAVLQRTIEATFAPCEIKTFRVPQNSAQPIVETNLLEWDNV